MKENPMTIPLYLALALVFAAMCFGFGVGAEMVEKGEKENAMAATAVSFVVSAFFWGGWLLS